MNVKHKRRARGEHHRVLRLWALNSVSVPFSAVMAFPAYTAEIPRSLPWTDTRVPEKSPASECLRGSHPPPQLISRGQEVSCVWASARASRRLRKGGRRALRADSEGCGQLAQEAALGVEARESAMACEGFDAAEVGADRQFGQQAEGADLRAAGDVGAAAKFSGEVADVDDADPLAPAASA
ncbi:hypothetical protein Stube_58410 [Streptomyces tubercidicus]|uniref:Uncharacterized protein n=1 Tax=Streptomyces tubercidicus TaxID=47759 RepID=A0A640UYC6_9ACTN|nr:hypothetical protein Stube_58410 [Streptomyces tubercidicus]